MNLTASKSRTEIESETAAFKNKASRIRIISMTLMDILFSWLACGVTYATIRPGLPFRHALISPVALFIMVPESVAWFYLIRTIRNGSR